MADSTMTPSYDWTPDFLRNGFVHLPHLVDDRLISNARRRIDEDLAKNYDPLLQQQYDSRSFCPAILGSADIMALFVNRAVKVQIDRLLVRKDLIFDEGQVAIRRAHNADENTPPSAHIDGIPTPHNGVPGNALAPFTLLVGVFLSDVTKEFAGNFTVWPGSHLLLEKYFNERGPSARFEGMPPVELGEPVQLCVLPEMLLSAITSLLMQRR